MKLLWLLIITAALGGLFILSRPARAAEPRPVACPNRQTVFLVGRVQPGEALLIMLRGRVVGGGVADQTGRYRLPLRVNERPGIYAGAILNRETRGTLARFDCYVDVPLPDGAVPVPPVATTPVSGPQAPFEPTPTRTAVAPNGATVTPRPSQVGANTPTPTQPGSATATPTPTRSAAVGVVQIIAIQLRNPPSAPREFVQIRNPSPTNAVAMGNWRLVNASRPAEVQPFIFPAFTLGGGLTATIFSMNGMSDLDLGEFYWNKSEDVWQAGDVAELRDAANNLVGTFTIVGED
ncbi:MAG: lamin tail domain-containing protein [Oscillochloridaceae bacterium umkhey_bin13]